MAEKEIKEHLIPTSYSAAIIAETGNSVDLQTSQIILVRDRSTKKWGPPAGHTTVLPDGTLESPYKTAVREWKEETGGLPMEFDRKPELSRTLFVYNQLQNKVSLGFIFSTSFKNGYEDKTFERDPKDILRFKTKPVDNGFEKDFVGLFNYHDIREILENWREKLYLPEINGDTLLNWCNSLAECYTGLYVPEINLTILRKELDFTWTPIEVGWPKV
jgi:8-oxo-dGTP pyrophosphatase MutT (NUDIX family)